MVQSPGTLQWSCLGKRRGTHRLSILGSKGFVGLPLPGHSPSLRKSGRNRSRAVGESCLRTCPQAPQQLPFLDPQAHVSGNGGWVLLHPLAIRKKFTDVSTGQSEGVISSEAPLCGCANLTVKTGRHMMWEDGRYSTNYILNKR